MLLLSFGDTRSVISLPLYLIPFTAHPKGFGFTAQFCDLTFAYKKTTKNDTTHAVNIANLYDKTYSQLKTRILMVIKRILHASGFSELTLM